MIAEFLTHDQLLVCLVVAVFSVVQSLFGVGLLVFGTPTLLLLGYPFNETLSYCLPPSIAISTIQAFYGRKAIKVFRRYVPLYILPFVILGLLFTLMTDGVDLNIYVGVMLILTAAVRSSRSIRALVKSAISKNLKYALMVTGLVHGMTNLGGAPLTIIASSIYEEKGRLRANIAFAYLLMAVSQIVILVVSREFVYSRVILFLTLIASTVYMTIGSHMFKMSREHVYQHMMTAFIVLFGLSMLLK